MRQLGFTLIEVLVVVAMLAVLVALAFPSYRYYIVQTQQRAASLHLLRAATSMQLYYSRQQSYLGASWTKLHLPAVDAQHQLQFELAELSPQHFLMRAECRSTGKILAQINEQGVLKQLQ